MRDCVYTAFLGVSLAAMLAMDLVVFYPPRVYRDAGSALHGLYGLRKWYARTFRDPYFLGEFLEDPDVVGALPPLAPADAAQPSWFVLFTYTELLVQLPLTLWILYRVYTHRVPSQAAKAKSPSGAGERSPASTVPTSAWDDPRVQLAALVLGLLVGLTSLTCVFDVTYWDEERYSRDEKLVFMTSIYGPWAALPTFMAADMYCRLYRLVGRLDG